MRLVENLAVSASRLFGVALIVAGALKLGRTESLASVMFAVGLGGAPGWFGSMIVAYELLVGGLLLVGGAGRLGQALGFLTAAGFGMLHLVGSGSCSCFGSDDLTPLAVAACVVGLVGCGYRTLFAERGAGASRLRVWSVVLVAAALAVAADRPGARAKAAALRSSIAGRTATTAVVGSLGCPECAALMRRVDSVGADLRRLLIVSQEDLGDARGHDPSRQVETVPDAVWWALLDGPAPTLLVSSDLAQAEWMPATKR